MLELHKQPKAKRKKEHTRLVIVTIGADAIAKTDDEVYVLSLIKVFFFIFFYFFLPVVPRKVELLNISKVMLLL